MNARQLEKLGIPRWACPQAIQAIQELVKQKSLSKPEVREQIRQVAESPSLFVGDPVMDALARELLEEGVLEHREPATYQTWGSDIDPAAHQQMQDACHLPDAVAGALMPDAHVGYGLPIGGVLAMDNAVVPYAVGVDIACRMKLSVLDVAPDDLDSQFHRFRVALEKGTCFGVGESHDQRQHHDVMDEDWTVTRITRENKDKAHRQLGSSGSGNHFAEFGVLTVTEDQADLGLPAGRYTALMTHSGSRGTGASVCSTYSAIAQQQLRRKHERFGRLAWLSMDSEPGQEYWAAMNLMGRYAAANHAVIHRLVSSLLGAQIIAGVENHHNFAWLEEHFGRQVVVHRKGATPASKGELGVIPGSMADPAFIVRGRGNEQSLRSASHGAGRCMSRRAAHDKYNFRAVQKDLERKGVRVLSAGADEVPGVYKKIESVMSEQSDLVEKVARFDPRIVKMCGDGSKAED